MIATAVRRGIVGHLLLTGIERTNTRPWIGAAGMGLAYLAYVLLEHLP